MTSPQRAWLSATKQDPDLETCLVTLVTYDDQMGLVACPFHFKTVAEQWLVKFEAKQCAPPPPSPSTEGRVEGREGRVTPA